VYVKNTANHAIKLKHQATFFLVITVCHSPRSRP